MEELLKSFMNQMNQQFGELSGKVDQLSSTVDQLSSTVNQLSNTVHHLTNDVQGLKKDMNRIETRLEKVEENQKNFEISLEHYGTEFRSHFIKIETELEQHREAIKMYAADLHYVKTDVEFLSGKTGIQDTKINNIEKRLEV